MVLGEVKHETIESYVFLDDNDDIISKISWILSIIARLDSEPMRTRICVT